MNCDPLSMIFLLRYSDLLGGRGIRIMSCEKCQGAGRLPPHAALITASSRPTIRGGFFIGEIPEDGILRRYLVGGWYDLSRKRGDFRS